MMTKTMGHIMPGAAPEYVHKSGDPDRYPLDSCFLQLWSAATYVQALVQGLLGIEPDAANHKVALTPTLPKGWQRAEVNNLRVGDTRFDVTILPGKSTVTQIEGPKLDIVVNGGA